MTRPPSLRTALRADRAAPSTPLALALLGLVTAAPAGAEIVTLRATGTVDYVCEVGLDGAPAAAITLGAERVRDELTVLGVRCNDPEGFRLDVYTSNDFRLVDDTGAFAIPYAIRLGASPGGLLDGVATAGGFARAVEAFVPEYAAGATASVALETVDGQVLPGGVPFVDEITFEITGL